MLRLVSSTVGPVSVAAGASSTQTAEAYNAGDSTLALQLSVDSSSKSWLAAATGASRACTTTTAASSCIPLVFTLNTQSLTNKKIYTGVVTVSDPNAVDAPQTITVTVQVGGGVPDTVDTYVAPGGSRDIRFYTNAPVAGSTATGDGGSWLRLALEGTGSFRFVLPYSIHLAPQAGNTAGNAYTGTLTTSGSSFAGDNKAVGVTMRVTSQAIAQASTDQLTVRLAQGEPALAPPFSPGVTLTNIGLAGSTLLPGTPTVSGGSWISYGAGGLTFDATGQSPGDYPGSITLPSNAANGSITVPVLFQVLPKGAPWIYYQGVQDNGTFVPGDPVTPGDVAVIKGEQLSFAGAYTPGPSPPLANQVGDVSVTVNSIPAPLYYALPFQVAFQVPMETKPGLALVQVKRSDGTVSNTASVNVVDRAPRLLLLGSTGYGAIVNLDGSLPMGSGTYGSFATHPAKAGDYLTIYAIGLGSTDPSVATGAPAPSAEPFARLTTVPVVNFSIGITNANSTPIFSGLSPTYAGLYQINVQIPEGTPKGTVQVRALFPDAVSNSVNIEVQ
jgi:uncharacterized protein (TIGR03437 family)